MKLMKVHNNLIDARYSLNLAQSKIFAYMVSRVFSNDDKLIPFRGSASDLCMVAEISRNYGRLEKSIDSLHDIKFSLRKHDHVVKFYMFHRVRYYDKGKIEIQFHEDMEPLLLNLKRNFTTAELEFFLRAKSHTSNKLYLICKRYLFKGEYDINLDELKNILFGAGDHEKYRLYADFKKRVLMPALNDINTMTDLSVTFRERKKGRAVASIVFQIKKKPPPAPKAKQKIEHVPESKQHHDRQHNKTMEKLRALWAKVPEADRAVMLSQESLFKMDGQEHEELIIIEWARNAGHI